MPEGCASRISSHLQKRQRELQRFCDLATVKLGGFLDAGLWLLGFRSLGLSNFLGFRGLGFRVQ